MKAVPERHRAQTPVLVKLRTGARSRAAAGVDLEPLFGDDPGRGPDDVDRRVAPEPGDFGLAGGTRWYLTELPVDDATPWDHAHARIADRLGVAESDVVFAEPDLDHTIYPDPGGDRPEGPFAAAPPCTGDPQDGSNGQAVGPHDQAWHLDDAFSQLGKARDAVAFADPRTRIAHIDTGYYHRHETLPLETLHHLEHSFVPGDPTPASAADPDRWALIDNSGHGTGTLGILAGSFRGEWNQKFLGAAPQAEVIPLRISDSVVLFKTSAFARALDYARKNDCDVVSMSMGGLPSRAWREAVDAAYLAGVCMATAAGNNFSGAPTRNLVYPARYARVIAVCGVMANHLPYTDLQGLKTMEGNYGPDSKMDSAIAAYTPNIPWARFGCDTTIRLNGGGTSSATPQVAAAAALWLEKYKAILPRDWQRVEAVRHALFSTARTTRFQKKLGHGILQAFDALAVEPRLNLPQTKSDGDSFSFIRVITGLGIVEATPRERMFNLELTQRWLVNEELQRLVPDPEGLERPGDLDRKAMRKVMEAIIEDAGASDALRSHVASRYPMIAGTSPPRTKKSAPIVAPTPAACDEIPALRAPTHRRLRVYSADPSLAGSFSTAAVSEATLEVRWEDLEPGPVGEYLEVVDTDAKGATYDPVDLNDPRLLARDGWAPSEGNAQFHQQMVYAVGMKTIGHFERALGRPVLWRPRPVPDKPSDDRTFVRRLQVRPHAIAQANAFYSPTEVALKFGYFDAGSDAIDVVAPGTRVYTCVSHDIIAHETTHALLDGMFRRFNEPTNADVLAFHEGFADIVALMQHFTLPEVLEAEIARTRGDIRGRSRLGSLAVEFGHATGRRGALRDAIGRMQDGVWVPIEPDPGDYLRTRTPHGRGAILVAAVFDAFTKIYASRTGDLIRLYTGGTGVLPEGAIHPDLVGRLAKEAAKSAGHVLNMCIRALDYLPPVDVTFFEFLRALITADYDLVPDDDHKYRVAFVEAFRRRGILQAGRPAGGPTGVAEHLRGDELPRTLSVETLRWQGVEHTDLPAGERRKVERAYARVVEGLKEYADACTYFQTREELFEATRKHRRRLHAQLKKAFASTPAFAREVGIDPEIKSFEVHELRRAMRVSPDGTITPQLIVALTQSRRVREGRTEGAPEFRFRGGATLVVDLSTPGVKYRIVKNVTSEDREKRTANYLAHTVADPLRQLYFGPDSQEPFAALHSLVEA
jgi:subtilisin family serine protease